MTPRYHDLIVMKTLDNIIMQEKNEHTNTTTAEILEGQQS